MMGSKSALMQQRKKLKYKLWRQRWDVLCPWCRKSIIQPDDAVLHEWLIRRAALPVKLQHLIMHEYNCILSHFQCHEDHETTKEFKLRCAKAQYARHSRAEIVAWVESLGLRQHVEIPTEEEANAAGDL